MKRRSTLIFFSREFLAGVKESRGKWKVALEPIL
jgi:hypothetical protein